MAIIFESANSVEDTFSIDEAHLSRQYLGGDEVDHAGLWFGLFGPVCETILIKVLKTLIS
jgi:hypothetical protein